MTKILQSLITIGSILSTASAGTSNEDHPNFHGVVGGNTFEEDVTFDQGFLKDKNASTQNYDEKKQERRMVKKTGRQTKKRKVTKSAKMAKSTKGNKSAKSNKNPEDIGGLNRPGCGSKLAASYTKDAVVGGTLYAFDPTTSDNGDEEKSWITMPDGKKFVDLAHSAIDAGCLPKRRPHMILPSPNGKYSVTTYFGDQDFHVLSNDDRAIIACVSCEYIKPSVFGGNVHTGVWLNDEQFMAVDFTGCYNGVCGGVLSKFEFTKDSDGIINGSNWLGSLGHEGVADARRTITTGPIAAGNNPIGNHAHLHFVSDSKGAGSIMDSTDMKWVKHFDVSEFGSCVGGGLWIYPHPTDGNIVLVVYGKQGDSSLPGGSCIFKVNMATQTIEHTMQLQDNADAHGIAYCKRDVDDELAVIVTMRQTATINVLNADDGFSYLEDYDLNGNIFDALNIAWYDESRHQGNRGLSPYEDHKLMPDLVFLHEDWLYITARGPVPVSAVKEQYFYHNAHPGMFAMKIDLSTCTPAIDQSAAFAVTTFERSPEKTSDVHGLYGVLSNGKYEIWAIDQAGTGSIESHDVYSACLAHDSIADPSPPHLIGGDQD